MNDFEKHLRAMNPDETEEIIQAALKIGEKDRIVRESRRLSEMNPSEI